MTVFKPFLWRVQELIATGVVTLIALVMLLVPQFPLPDGKPPGYLGKSVATSNELDTGGVTPAEFDYQKRNQKKGQLYVAYVGERGAKLRENFPKAQVRHIQMGVLFDDFRTMCKKDNSVVFVDDGGSQGAAALASILYRINECDAMWLVGGIPNYLKWMQDRNQVVHLKPVVRPAGLALQPAALPPPPKNMKFPTAKLPRPSIAKPAAKPAAGKKPAAKGDDKEEKEDGPPPGGC